MDREIESIKKKKKNRMERCRDFAMSGWPEQLFEGHTDIEKSQQLSNRNKTLREKRGQNK